jgi:hypothetical protein
MRGQNFVDRVRLLLSVGPFNVPSSIPINCSCGQRYTRDSDPLHCIHCFKNRGACTRRHTSILNLLYSLIRFLYPLDNVYKDIPHCTVGQRVSGHIPPVIQDVICDILWEDGPLSHIIDLNIVDPSCSRLNVPAPSLINPRPYNTVNGAALAGEKKKRVHYAKVSLPAPLDPSRIIPFTIEATGRLGPSALAFLFKICGSNTYRRSLFLRDVSSICARFSGKFLSASRDQYRAGPQNGVL